MARTKRMQLSLAQFIFLKNRPAGAEDVPPVKFAKACIAAANDAKVAKSKNPRAFYWAGRSISYAMTRRNALLGLDFVQDEAFWKWKAS